MADLTNAQRYQIWAEWMRDNTQGVSITKQQLRTAFNEMDTFIGNNVGNIFDAVSEPAKSALTNRQKAHIFYLIVKTRWEDA